MSEWIRARCDSHACFEVHIGLTDVTVRNTERPDQVAAFTYPEWAAFLADAKQGRFDLEVTDARGGEAAGD